MNDPEQPKMPPFEEVMSTTLKNLVQWDVLSEAQPKQRPTETQPEEQTSVDESGSESDADEEPMPDE